MSEHSGASTLAAMTLEEPGAEQASPRAPGPLRCGPCAVWPRQQTWLCAVPLVMGFVGLGLSLMLLKWIVVGSVQDYVPTDLVDPKSINGQDPIFLSKPSAMPKGPDISTATTSLATSTTAMVSTTTPLAADGTAPVPRTRSGPPANHSANGSSSNGDGNRAPHLHNRVGTRVSGTAVTTSATRATRLTPVPSGKEVTPRGTARKGSSTSNGRNGAANSKPEQTPPTVTTTTSTTTTATAKNNAKVQPNTTSQPAAPMKPTSRWNHGRPGKGPATRPHHRIRPPLAPTPPSVRSEVFKSCVEDKDRAFCMNDGECSIIETVAGVHRHCRCKEGYHGLRCDQFVPKSDAILSDPTDELGIEFMESGDTYQRQVLSIFSIASGICLLGVACMALYRRNKRHREKLQAHFSDSRSLRDCSVNSPGLMSSSTPRTQYNLHLQNGCGSHGSSLKGSSVAPGSSTVTPPILSKALSKGKCFRSSSLSLSPAQQRREVNHFRTPPISRGKHKISTSLIDGTRVTGHVYKHLQEDESTDMEPIRRCDSASRKVGALLTRTALAKTTARKGWTEVPCTRLDKGTTFLPHSLRARSVPIIPSLQACDPEAEAARTSDRSHAGLLKWQPAPSGQLAKPTGSPPPPPGNVWLETDISARSINPPVVTRALLESEKKASCSVEFTEEIVQGLKQKSLSSQEEMYGSHSESQRGGTNILEAETEPESGGKGVQYLAGAAHTASGTSGVKVEGQREVQGQSQGQTSLANRRANSFLATKGPSCRGTGNTYAKPSAS